MSEPVIKEETIGDARFVFTEVTLRSAGRKAIRVVVTGISDGVELKNRYLQRDETPDDFMANWIP